MSRRMSTEDLRIRHTEQFFTLVERGADPDMCWGWRGAMKGTYGSFQFVRTSTKAHVASYLIHTGLSYGDLPEDPTRSGFKMSVLHSCPNRTCCNPRHLRLGTHLENMDDVRRDGTARNRARHLSHDEVLAVIENFRTSPDTGRAVALRHGLKPETVGSILRGDHYAGVVPEIPRPVRKLKAA